MLRAGAPTGGWPSAPCPCWHPTHPNLYDGLTGGLGLVCVLGSGVFGVATLALVWRSRFSAARLTAAAAVVAAVAGLGRRAEPDLLPGELTLEQAAAGDATLFAFLASLGLGALVLVPSLVYLYRLVLRGTLDQNYEPLDQRFKPQ